MVSRNIYTWKPSEKLYMTYIWLKILTYVYAYKMKKTISSFFSRRIHCRKLSKRWPDQIKHSYGINRPLIQKQIRSFYGVWPRKNTRMGIQTVYIFFVFYCFFKKNKKKNKIIIMLFFILYNRIFFLQIL